MDAQEQKIITAKQHFQQSIEDRFKNSDLQLNPETPGSDGFVLGTEDGSRRVRAVFHCDQDDVQVDLYRPLGAGWDSEPFERGLRDFERAGFLIQEELKGNEQKIQ
ncbi:hypothetical protein [Deinococcus cellulosilyticus]|uniref:Uncharacterized protein n=1 Tax=Deinococcus cellulosilyticus (strain DSM 18568 / NBRC 106333 / KACC 11606 / 5516J-15) TaxID=1223518 RepID=A0A511MYR7_DEIC1|nr:hypothetical protein [Deinococcus cellulosilyticus]GEM45709.1 hypothetical protein DC3_13440 [Deinococcus cellulosilyticus NBRC 106333 = KACC 11606]